MFYFLKYILILFQSIILPKDNNVERIKCQENLMIAEIFAKSSASCGTKSYFPLSFRCVLKGFLRLEFKLIILSLKSVVKFLDSLERNKKLGVLIATVGRNCRNRRET